MDNNIGINEKDELIKTISLLDKKLKDLNEKLISSESFKQTFISNLKNELLDPITTVFLIVSYLKKSEFAKDVYLDYLNALFKETLTLYHKLQNIFTAADLESGEVSLRCDKVMLKPFIIDIIDIFSLKIKEKQLSVNVSILCEDNADFTTDAEKLKLILMNLINDAIFYSKENNLIDILVSYHGDELKIEIMDDGEAFEANQVSDNFVELISMGIDSHFGKRARNLSYVVTKMLTEILDGRITTGKKEQRNLISISIPKSMLSSEDISLKGNEFYFNDTEQF
jgi:K+-sensing histidine kinase KdpD